MIVHGLCGHYSAMKSATKPAPAKPDIRDQFHIDENRCYVNHAAISPWPLCTATAVKQFADENVRLGPENYPEWVAHETALRKNLALLLNAPSRSDIALLKNTTDGISTVAFGLDLQAGDNIVIPLDEFSSNSLPWLAQSSRGVEVRQVDIRKADNAEAALLQAVDQRTRVLAVSAVQWTDGFRLDLEQLGAHCRAREVLFFVDAIQQLGALRLDVAAAQIDFLAADAHKWLLGPEGIAVFFSTAKAREQLKLLQLGWHMLENHWSFSGSAVPTKTARRFEAGSSNTLGQVAMHASLQLLLAQGMEYVEHRVLANTGHLLGGLQQIKGIQITSRTDATRRSGIVSFNSSLKKARPLHAALQGLGLRCSLRNEAIRLSPHFYQDENLMQRILGMVEQACR